VAPAARRWLFWTPRVLTLIFAAFISIFAFDVFEGRQDTWHLIVALGRHLIPTALVLVLLVLAWRWEWVGALAYVGLGAFYIAWSWGRFHWSAYAFIAGPLFLVGLLFLLNWVHRDELRGRP
jgi:hypothetical protein